MAIVSEVGCLVHCAGHTAGQWIYIYIEAGSSSICGVRGESGTGKADPPRVAFVQQA